MKLFKLRNYSIKEQYEMSDADFFSVTYFNKNNAFCIRNVDKTETTLEQLYEDLDIDPDNDCQFDNEDVASDLESFLGIFKKNKI